MTPTASPIHIEALRLSPADDLRAAMQGAWHALAQAHGAQAGCVVSAVGSLDGAVLRYAARPQGTRITGALELLALLPGWRFTRAPDAATGFMELVVGRV